MHTHRCAKVKRERERDKGKIVRIKVQPQCITYEFRGYQTKDMAKAMTGSLAFATAIDRKTKSITY